MAEAIEFKACIRTDYPEGYIDLYYTEASHEATIELVEHLKMIVAESNQYEETRVVRILSNATGINDSLPMIYLMSLLRKNHALLQVHQPTYFAAMFHDNLLVGLILNFARSFNFGNLTFRPFSEKEKEQAIQWLLAQE